MDKLYISADIEGCCGVADWHETELESPQSAYFRKEMTMEVKAACDAAMAAGVSDIFIKDAHDSGRNLDPEALPECSRIMRAWSRNPYSMMAGLDESFDAALFIGFHSASGSNGNPLSHTLSTSTQRIWVNGRLASEFLINTYTAALFTVPVVLVSGDRALCESARELCPAIEAVPVIEGLGAATTSIHPSLAQRRIKEAAERALSGDTSRFLIDLPDSFEVEIEFHKHSQAYRASFYPGARAEGALSVQFSAKSWREILAFMYFVL